ncbi:phage holin family protein [Phycisphaerales bacterium AB-hyl4]|uniref:Phage holin family protein n=1 Tax=Natronomicrosphaera hydrolytica TaxID=3242702 RepID=A0ABV4U875_9BACT
MRRIIDTDPRTFGELLKDLKDQTSYLFRREIDLARTELTEKGQQVARHSTLVIAGAVVGLLAAITLCIALSFALTSLFALIMPIGVAYWLGPLVVAIALGLGAWGLIHVGIKRLREQHYRPDQTVDSLQENQQWLKEKVT